MGSSRVLRFTTVDPRFAFLSRKSGGAHDENPRFDHISLAADRLIPKPKSLTMKFSNSALILALATTTEAFAPNLVRKTKVSLLAAQESNGAPFVLDVVELFFVFGFFDNSSHIYRLNL